jgi:hypothetical protein
VSAKQTQKSFLSFAQSLNDLPAIPGSSVIIRNEFESRIIVQAWHVPDGCDSFCRRGRHCTEAVQKERIMAGQTFTEGIPM